MFAHKSLQRHDPNRPKISKNIPNALQKTNTFDPVTRFLLASQGIPLLLIRSISEARVRELELNKIPKDFSRSTVIFIKKKMSLLNYEYLHFEWF